MTEQQPAVAPGWYPQPDGSQRYWDGHAWGPAAPPSPAAVAVPVGPSTAITYQRKRTSHLLHLILTVLTGGLWGLFVWLPLTLWHRMGPRQRVKTKYR